MQTRNLVQSQALYLDRSIGSIEHGINHRVNITIPGGRAVHEDSVGRLLQAFVAVGE